MRELTNKIMKSIFRIAICSIGGVLSIIGILSGSYALVQIPDGASKYMPCVVTALLTLPAGLYFCYLVIKPNLYLVKSRKMSKEEKVIENIKKYMRHRKSQIGALTFILILYVFFLIWLLMMDNKFSKTITSEDIRLLKFVKILLYEWHFSIFTGLLIGTLIIEISGINRDKHRLTVNMWERIQELESEVKELKAPTQVDG
ncbi:MAG: hypothetical protein FVQ84_09490 [Planctomycetes bacterium]|nr:hypothetical protein [Planctomycetota bacterium]